MKMYRGMLIETLQDLLTPDETGRTEAGANLTLVNASGMLLIALRLEDVAIELRRLNETLKANQ